jgi:hypothetical protein
MKNYWAIGWLLVIIGLGGLIYTSIHFIPAYVLAERTFPDDTTWQKMCDWLFKMLIPLAISAGGIGWLLAMREESKKDKMVDK